jgi:hypothetical protein
MNRLLKFGPAALAVALLTSLPARADKPADKAEKPLPPPPADVSGKWIVTIRSPIGTQESQVKLEKNKDKYIGAITDPRGQTTQIQDVEYKDGELSFKIAGERQGQKFAIEYAAKVNGDKFKGKLTFKSARQSRSIDLDGRKESPVEGVWKIAFVLESGQKLQSSIQVKGGDTFSGDYVGISGQKAKAKNVKFENGDLSFDAPDHADNDDLLFHYAGKVADDKLKGTVSWTASGKQTMSLKFDGEKSKVQTANVAGTWKFKIPMKDGSAFEPTLKLSQTGSAVTGTYTGEQGDTPITQALVLANELTLTVTRKKDNKSYVLRYQGKVEGDAIKGTVDYNFDGVVGFFDFEGKRTTPSAAPKP